MKFNLKFNSHDDIQKEFYIFIFMIASFFNLNINAINILRNDPNLKIKVINKNGEVDFFKLYDLYDLMDENMGFCSLNIARSYLENYALCVKNKK